MRKKPRPGVKCNCSSAMIHHEPKATDKGCRNHRYRLSWNLEQWWNWKFKYKLERFICNYIRRPIGRLRKPVPLQWQALNDEPVDFNNNKYYISYNLLLKDFRIFYDDVVKSDEIYFSSKEKAEEALEVFKDELEWYYTEFYRRLDERK